MARGRAVAVLEGDEIAEQLTELAGGLGLVSGTRLTAGQTLPTEAPCRKAQVPVAALVLFLAAELIFFGLIAVLLRARELVQHRRRSRSTGCSPPATPLLVAGQFDLSVGSGVAFVAVTMAYVSGNQPPSHGKPLVLGVLAAIGCGLAIGMVNGFFVTVVGVNALITTLGMLAVLRGLAQVLASGQTVLLDTFGGLGQGRIAGVPFDIPVAAVILVVVLLLFWAVMRYTVYGRSMYAIGANPVAARLTGIRSPRLIFLVP